MPAPPPERGKVGNGAKFAECRAGCGTVHDGRLAVAQPMADVGDQHPRAGHLVGHSEIPPGGQRGLETGERRIEPVRNRQDGAGGGVRHRLQQRHPQAARAGGKLVGGGDGEVVLAGGEEYLHRRAQQPEPARIAAGDGDTAACPARGSDRGERRFDLAAAQSQQRVSRFRVDAVTHRLAVAAVGRFELAEQPMQFALLVMRPSDRRFRLAGQPVACPLGLPHRAPPVAAHLQYLGPVDQALAAKRHQIGLRPAPRVERPRPLARPLGIEDALTGQDHGAVDDAAEDRRNVVAGHRNHRFIQARDTLPGSARGDQGLTAAEQRKGQKVRVVELRRERHRILESPQRAAAVVSVQCAKADHYPAEPLFDVAPGRSLEQSLRACQPAAAD